jgi:hypothetical protein
VHTISPTQPISTIATRVVAEVDSAESLRSVAEKLVTNGVGAVLVHVHVAGTPPDQDHRPHPVGARCSGQAHSGPPGVLGLTS